MIEWIKEVAEYAWENFREGIRASIGFVSFVVSFAVIAATFAAIVLGLVVAVCLIFGIGPR